MYGVDSVGLDGEVKKFEKPIFQTWLMFLAMAFALPIHWACNYHLVRKQWQCNKHGNVPCITMLSTKTDRYRISRETYFLLALPAAFDLTATFVANLGLLYITVSVFQLMKCTVIVFVALLKVFVLKESLHGYKWVGIGLNMLAIVMVGATSLADADNQSNNSTSQHPGVGTLMIIMSGAIRAIQYVIEERLMGEGHRAPPLVVVGMEGVWGLILTSCIVYPVAYAIPGSDKGSSERFDDACVMVLNSRLAQTVVIVNEVVTLAFNICTVSVTYLLSSIWRAILDNFRPVAVWGFDLLLFYILSQGQFGERWTNWSWLELAGMLTLFVGTAVYNGTLRLHGFVYSKSAIEELIPINQPDALISPTIPSQE
ncbi:unnamed protein product [Phytophthora lilii]|uniref:Unnamed protein product n=1 Tax=Phytophthora lilii TaxID=2077276 RepID=A0A9W6U588_9STRA|nr:unnamed protein product [Phytophthora lilii]